MFDALKKSRFLYWILSRFHSGKKTATKNYAANLCAWEDSAHASTFLHSQSHAPVSTLRYGRCEASANGCAAVAIFNVLTFLGNAANLPDIFYALEQKGLLWFGHLGTDPRAVAAYLQSQGLTVHIEKTPARFESLLQDSDAVILFYWNSPSLRDGAHYVMLQKAPTAQDTTGLCVYNFSNTHKADSLPSLQALLEGKGPVVMMIGVQKQKPLEKLD